MKAVAVFPAERRFDVIDHPEPAIGSASDVKLRMLDVGICGTDKEIVSFEYGTAPPGSPYLIIGHESLGQVVDAGSGVKRVKPGDLVVATVRRPCTVSTCAACAAGRPDFCYSGQYTERGIQKRHGYMTEFVVEEERYLNPVPHSLRDVAVLVEPLTIAEKGIAQLFEIQERLPWTPHGRNAVVLGGGPVGLLGAMKLVLEGFSTTVYSRTPPSGDLKDLVTSIGAKLAPAETMTVEAMAAETGNIDVVYEAAGSSSLAFETMRYLGTNGVFIFTGVPNSHGQASEDIDQLMRQYVLKNQVIFGTVNASLAHFRAAIADLDAFDVRWPDTVRKLISHRFPIAQAVEPLSGKAAESKT